MALTEAQVKKAKALPKKYQLADDEGLSLVVEPSGRKHWKYRYTNKGARAEKRLGAYPDLTLRQARQARDDFQLSLDNQADIETILTFSDVANEWMDFKTKNSLGDKPRCGVLQLAQRCLESDILPIIGDIEFSSIKRLDLVKVVREIENRGVKEPVKKACSYLNQIYDYAVAMGYCEYNIAHGLHKILINNKIKKNYPYLNSDELSSFLARLKQVNTDPIIKKALLFKLYTGVRGGELLLCEPHHFDLDKKIWKIPALHIKQYRRKVILGHDIPEFLVPLSDQALEVVRSALIWSHGDKYVFSSPRNNNKPIHFNTLNLIIRKMGYTKNELSSHGLRSTFSTILNESGLFQSNWIEAQLSHIDKNKTRASYNHAEYFNQRIEMMQWWGDFIDSCTVN